MAKVTAVKAQSFGHSHVELDNNTAVTIPRGTPVPKVGDEYVPHVPPPVPEHPKYAHAAGKPAQAPK